METQLRGAQRRKPLSLHNYVRTRYGSGTGQSVLDQLQHNQTATPPECEQNLHFLFNLGLRRRISSQAQEYARYADFHLTCGIRTYMQKLTIEKQSV